MGAVSPREHLHSLLFADDALRRDFHGRVQPQVVGKLEEKLLHPRRIPRMSERDIEAVVTRMLSHGDVAVANELVQQLEAEDARTHRGRPFLTAESRYLSAARREHLNEPADIVERLLTRPRPHSASSHARLEGGSKMAVSATSNEIATTARRRHICDLFVELARNTRKGIRSEQAAADPAFTVPLTELAGASATILDARGCEELLSALSHSTRLSLNMDQFVEVILADVARAGPNSFSGFRKHAAKDKETQRVLEEFRDRPLISKNSQEIASHRRGDTLWRLTRPVDRTEEERERQEKEAHAMDECTFAPAITTFKGRPQYRKDPAQPSRSLVAQQQQQQSPAHARGGAADSSSGQDTSCRSADPIEEPAQQPHVEARKRRTAEAKARGARGGNVPFQPPLSERAAFTGTGALRDFGRELMKRQLVDAASSKKVAH